MESTGKKTLGALARRVALETHRLQKAPWLVFQQLYNQLQWEDSPAKEMAEGGMQRFLASGRLFLHQYRVPEKETGYLKTTLNFPGSSGQRMNCTYSPDGSQIAAAGSSGLLMIWDAETGKEVMSFEGCGQHCAYSPDGKKMLTTGKGKAVQVIDLSTRNVTLTLEGHPGNISSCSFSRDGRKIASSDYEGTIKVWEASTGREIANFNNESEPKPPQPESLWGGSGALSFVRAQMRAQLGAQVGGLKSKGNPVNECAFSPDGKRIVAAEGGIDHVPEVLRIWDVDTGRAIKTLGGHTDTIRSCAFSPDGKKIISSGFDQTIRIWDAETGSETERIKVKRYPESLDFSQDGKRILYGCDDGTIRIWDIDAKREIFKVKGHVKRACSSRFSSHGDNVISASQDGTIKVWDIGGGYESTTLKVDTRPANMFAFSPDSRHVVSRGPSLILWDLETGKRIQTLASYMFLIHGCAYSPDGKDIVSSHTERNCFLCIWDVRSRELKSKVEKRHNASVCTYSPDGARVLSAHDSDIVVWDPKTAKEIVTFKGHKELVTSCRYSLDGKRIISTGDDETLKIWDAQDHRELASIRIPERYSKYEDYEERDYRKRKTFDFSPDGKRIICANKYSLGYGWRFQLLSLDNDGRQLDQTSKCSPAQCLFSDDGRSIMCIPAGYGRPVTILKSRDMDIGREICAQVAIYDVAFSPDGEQIMTAGKDGTVMIWDTRSGNERGRFYVEGPVRACAYSGDGRSLVVSDGIGNIYFLRLKGKETGPPYVTATRLWLFEKDQGKGGWDDRYLVRCRWCGRPFKVAGGVLEAIRSMERKADLSPEQSPCMMLPAEAWEEPRLIAHCPHCHGGLKFNPFVVDNQGVL